MLGYLMFDSYSSSINSMYSCCLPDIDVKGDAVFNKAQPLGGKEPVGLKDRPGGGKQEPPIPQEPDEKQVTLQSQDEWETVVTFVEFHIKPS